jgi:hypothetical protein
MNIPRNEFDDGMISMAHNCQAKLELMCMDILKGGDVQEVFGQAQRWLHEVIEGGQVEHKDERNVK